jgi:hypothetical protein
VLEVVQQRRPLVPAHLRRAVDDVVAVQRRDRNERDIRDVELGDDLAEVACDRVVDGLVELDQVHLVHADHQVADADQRGDVRVTARLLEHSLARVDQDHRHVGGRGARDHVARVLDVAGGVGDDEAALGRREVAVCDVDRDALLALGAQPVCEQGQVHVAVAAAPARLLHVLELVLEDLLGVEQQAPDQGRLAVVDRPDYRQPQLAGGVVVRVVLERARVAVGGGAGSHG